MLRIGILPRKLIDIHLGAPWGQRFLWSSESLDRVSLAGRAFDVGRRLFVWSIGL